jgi:hypothetical protein
MPRRIGYWLAFGVAAAGLVWAGWPGAPDHLATLINRTDVIVTVVLLAGLPWATRKVFGPVGGSRLARIARLTGYAAVFALALVKAHVERLGYAAVAGRPMPAGVWAGEILYLVVLAAYVTGILALTAWRPPAGPAALAMGAGAGALAGLVMYALPLRNQPHITNGWLAGADGAARVLAVPLTAGAVVVAGWAVARRTPLRSVLRPQAGAPARQAIAAGLWAGMAGALMVSVLGIGTIALVPHELGRLSWTLPTHQLPPGTVYAFESSVSSSAAGYLLVLVFFPLLGAGLGAWGGLCAAERSGPRPGGDGGPGEPAPLPPPPGGDARLDDEPQPVLVPAGR